MKTCKAEYNPGEDKMECVCGNNWSPHGGNPASKCKPIVTRHVDVGSLVAPAACAWVIERKGHAPVLTHYADVANCARLDEANRVTPYVSAWPK